MSLGDFFLRVLEIFDLKGVCAKGCGGSNINKAHPIWRVFSRRK